MTLSRLLACGVAGLAGHAGAAAQQAQRSIDLTASVRTLYDSNVARSSESVAELRGLIPEDVRFSPTVQLQARLPAGRHDFYSSAVAGYDFYARNTQLDRENLQGRLGVNSDLRFCRTTVEASVGRRQTALEDIIIGEVDNVETVTEALARLSCPRPAGLYPSAQISYRATENERPIRRTADIRTLTAESVINYVGPSLGEAGLLFRYSKSTFPNRSIPMGPAGARTERFDTWSAGMQLSRNVGSLLRGSATASYTATKRTGDQSKFDGITYAISLQVRPEQRLHGTLVAERAVKPSERVGFSYSVDERYRAGLGYRLTPKVDINAGASFRDSDYVASLAGNPFLLTHEQTNTLFANMQIGLSQRLYVVVDASREERDANVPAFDYISNRIGLTANIVF